MLDFKPSAELIRNILTCIKATGIKMPIATPQAVENLRTQMGGNIIDGIVMEARFARQDTVTEFPIFQDGQLLTAAEKNILLPSNKEGEHLLEELRAEFLAWAKVEGCATEFSETAPIQKLFMRGEDVLVELLPAEPRTSSPRPKMPELKLKLR